MSPVTGSRSDSADHVKNSDMFQFMRTAYEDSKREFQCKGEFREQATVYKYELEKSKENVNTVSAALDVKTKELEHQRALMKYCLEKNQQHELAASNQLLIAEEAVSARQKLEAEWESLRVKLEADVGNAKDREFQEEKSKWDSETRAAETRHEQELLEHVASMSTLKRLEAQLAEKEKLKVWLVLFADIAGSSVTFIESQVAKGQVIESQKILLSLKDRKVKELSLKLQEMETRERMEKTVKLCMVNRVRVAQGKIDDLNLSLKGSATDLILAKYDVECKDKQIALLHKKFEDVKDFIASEAPIYSFRISGLIGGAEQSEQEPNSITADVDTRSSV